MNKIYGVFDTTRARAAYDTILARVAEINGVFDTGMIVNEDYFLSEQLISDSKTVYKFDVLAQTMDADRQSWPNQKGVQNNDIFIGLCMLMTIDHREEGKSNILPQTYPNPYQFTAANTGNFEDLYAFYSGNWGLTVGSRVYIPNMSTRLFLDVPQTQQSLAANANGSQFNGNKLVELDPYPVLSGKADNKLTLNINTYEDFAAAALAGQGQNVVSFFMKGITVQNGANFADFVTGMKSITREAILAAKR
ncbi:hypothetical protein [Methylotenera sp.]|uniref:hypothetical protein n=1 Tax=Methylotenera sp. TaxID=2051956 RepID=UPI002EDA42B0